MELTVGQGHSADWKINRVKSAQQRRAYTIRLLHLYTIQNTENKSLQLESRRGAALGVEVRGGEAVIGRDPERAGGSRGMGGLVLFQHLIWVLFSLVKSYQAVHL